MSIYYLLLEAKPLSDNEESNEVAGAFINCWVNSDNEAIAKEEAIRYITNDEGWHVLSIEEIKTVSPEWYLDEPESLDCYNQAVEDGVSAIFNIWPIGAEDD